MATLQSLHGKVAAKTPKNYCALFSPEILFDANCEGNPFFGVPPERRRKATTNAAAGGSNASAAAAGLDGSLSLRSDDGSTEGTKYVRKDGREGKRFTGCVDIWTLILISTPNESASIRGL